MHSLIYQFAPPNTLRQCWTALDGTRLRQIASDCFRLLQTASDCFRLLHCFRLEQTGADWSRLEQTAVDCCGRLPQTGRLGWADLDCDVWRVSQTLLFLRTCSGWSRL